MPTLGPIPFSTALPAVNPAKAAHAAWIRAQVAPVSRAGTATDAARTLAAGRVDTPADPMLAPGVRPAAGSLALYTRAADRIEAATGVELGSLVDRQA